MSRGPINEVIHKINSENKNNGKAFASKPGPKTLPKTGRGARPRNANMAYKEVSISGNHVKDIATATAEENDVLVSLSIHPSSNSTDIQGKDWVSYQAESKFLSPVESKENIQEKNGVLHANVPKSNSQMQSTSSKQQYIYNINVVNRDHDMDLKPRSKPLPKPRYVRGARSSNTAVLSSTYSAQTPETTKHIDYSLPKAGIHVKTMPEYPIRQFDTDSELNENDYILELDSKPTVAKKSTVTYVNWPIPAHVENRGENSPYACRVVTTEKYSMPEDRFLSETTADSGIEETVKNLSKCQSKPRETNGINLSEKMTVSDTANPKIENITEANMSKRNRATGPSPYHKFLGGTTAESNQKTANQYVNRYITSNGLGRMKVTFGTNDTTMECDGANFSGNTVQDTETITVNLSCIQNNNRTSYQTEPKFACILEQNETTKQEKCRFLQANFSTITKNMLYASTQSMCKNKSAKAVNNEAALAKPGPKQIPGYVREAIPKATTSTKNEAISPKTTSNINCPLSKVEIDTDYHPNSTRTCENEQDATDLCYSDNLLNLLPTSKTAYREKRPVPLPRKKKLARANSRIKIFGGHMQRFSLEQNVGIRKNSRIVQHESGTECASKTLPISDEVMYISPRRLTRQQNGVRRYHIVFDNPLYMTKVSEVHTKYPSYRHREHSHHFVEAYPPRIPPKQRPFNGTHTSTLGNMSSNFELQLKNDDQTSISGNEKHSNCGCVYNNLAVCDERETPPKIPPKQRPFHSKANEGVWSTLLSPIIEENLSSELPIKLQRAILSESLPDNHIISWAPTALNLSVPFNGDNVKLTVLPTDEAKGTRYVNETFSTNTTDARVEEMPLPKPRTRKPKNITEADSDIGPRLPPRLYRTYMSLDEHFQGLSVSESIRETNESNPCDKGKEDHNIEYSNNCFQKQMETASNKKSALFTEKNIGNMSSAKVFNACCDTSIYADIAELYIPEKSMVENSHIYEQVDPTEKQDTGTLTPGKCGVKHKTSKSKDYDYDYDYPDCNKLSRLAKAYEKWCLSLCPKCRQKPRNYSRTKSCLKCRMQKTGGCFKSKESTSASTSDRKCSFKNESNGSHQAKARHYTACSCENGSRGSHSSCSCSSHGVPACSCGNSSCGSENSLPCSSRHHVPVCSCGNSSCGSQNSLACSSFCAQACSCGNSSHGSHNSASCNSHFVSACSCANSSCGTYNYCPCSSRHYTSCSCGNSSCGSLSSCSCSNVQNSCGNSCCGFRNCCSSGSVCHMACSCGNSSDGSSQVGYFECPPYGKSADTRHHASSCKAKYALDTKCWKGNDQRELDNIFSMVYFPGNARSPTFSK